MAHQELQSMALEFIALMMALFGCGIVLLGIFLMAHMSLERGATRWAGMVGGLIFCAGGTWAAIWGITHP